MKKLLLSPVVSLLILGLPTALLADTTVVFNEIMYHPATNEASMEWVELRNQMAVDVDISGWSISGGIQFTFASNTIVRGGGYALVALSPPTLMAAAGSTNVLGPFAGRLSNSGDTLRLRNNSGRIVDEVNYGTDGDWPVGPDGSGVSLAKRDGDTASGAPSNWTGSDQIGGTPGIQNFAQANGFVTPAGLVSYWNFNEASGALVLDSTGQNPGTLGTGVTHVASSTGGALSFDGTSNAYVNVGLGANNSFAVTGGITLEAVITPGWSSTNSAVIFKKAPRRPASYRDTVMTNNPVAYWRLGDATTTIADSTVNARTGAATAGVLLNQPSLIASDSGNGAVRVGGADRIVVPGFEKIGAAGYSVEYWVKPTSLPTTCCQSLVGDGEAGGDYFMMNYILGPAQGTAGGIRPHFGPGNSPVSMDSVTALQVGNTYHIVTTWDTSQAANNAVIYINGVADRIGTTSRNVPVAGTTGANKVYIGIDDRGTTEGVNTIDEAAIYNRPLSASEVAAHYAAAVTTNFDLNLGNAVQLAFQNDGNNAAANPPVAAGPVLSFGLAVGGVYSELDMPLDGASGRPTLAALEDGNPHHVTATYNSATGVKAIYVDGTLRFSTTLSGSVAANNGASAILGNSETSGVTPFVGTLDEMTYWGRALSAAEIAAHAGAAQAGRDYFSPPPPDASTALAFNELSSSTNAEFWLELMNYGASNITLSGYVIVRDGPVKNEYVFPAGPSISAGGYRAVTNSTLGFHPVSGDKLYLLPPSRDRVLDAVLVKTRPVARTPAGTGPWLHPSAPSPGGLNSFALHTEIVINEIMYSHRDVPGTNGLPPTNSRESWLELHNKSGGPVDLTGWELGGGISYRFFNKTIAAGGYLVVAKDAAFLRTVYPSIDIVGDFSGGLSGSSDTVTLNDPAGNPASKVRYFDSSPWPAFAAGGGSSLELRDPRADISKAESWAASDESGKSSWQTVSYTNLASIPSGSGQPNVWNEFILGLLADGECLIDDISVVESPATAPVQMVANGNFENGQTGWRTLGTHVRSRVEVDPDNPGNHVLHVIASGAQEHMHNHIETSTIGYRAINPALQYQITYRARWLGGNNLLNTRLYFNRCARTTALPVAALNGTPGAANSRYATNIGPTFSQFRHLPIVPLPGTPATVSVVARDPQGIASCEVWWATNGGTFTNASMTLQGDGLYTGPIPGYAPGTIVQFYVRAVDGSGAASTYPAAGPNSGALYAVADGQANLSLGHNIRIVMPPSRVDLLYASTNVMSNDRLPCTVIYDESRAYYGVGIRLKGSQRGRANTDRISYHMEFPAEDPFRGVHAYMLVDRSGAGDSTANKQQEILIKHMLLRAGRIPSTQPDMCRVIAPRSVNTGPALLSPRHEDQFVETAFDNGGSGTQWELELIYYPNAGQTNQFGYKFVAQPPPNNDSVVGTDISDLGADKEFYRYNFILKTHRDADDYSRFIAFGKAMSLTGSALEQQAKITMDVNDWMRTWALVTLCGVGDTYTFGNNHNLFMYSRPSDGRMVPFPVDMDFSFNRGTTAALVGDQNISKVISLTPNLRSFYAHILDIISESYNTPYMTYWVNHYKKFAPDQDYTPVLAYIQARSDFARTTITNAGGFAAFAVTGTNYIVTSNNLVTLTGTAPVSVKTIWINGAEYAVTWTSLSTWTLRVAVAAATNVLNVTGYDVRGNPLTNFSRTITVNYTGATPAPEGVVVMNEIMYNSVTPDAGYVELYNSSPTVSFDLSNWRLNGLDYTFPAGSVLTNRQYLVLARNAAVYASTYPGAPQAFDQANGALQNDGETLTLLRPGANPGEEIVVDRVRYEPALPWPTSAGGTGPSLQLIDPAQDNSRVANWSDGSGWRYFTYTANIGSAYSSNLSIFLTNIASDIYLDDISLVQGSVPEAGLNYVTNGGFELPLSPYWAVSGLASNSAIVSTVAHSGNSSLHLVYAFGAPSLTAFYQIVTNAVPQGPAVNTFFTMSFWYLPGTNSTMIQARLNSAYKLANEIKSIRSTPGVANSITAVLPPFPSLWLNEAQPENLAGLTDNQGEHEPWVELYNSGTNPISLAGCYLANNYSNLTQWAFPPDAVLQPGQFKVVFADGEPGETTAGEWHANFRLDPGHGSVALAWTPSGVQVLDYLNYTNLPSGRSYGDFPDGQPFSRQEFYRPTPAGTNDNLAAPLAVYINEWMAHNTSTLLNTNNNNKYDDWFEIQNPSGAPANLGGYFLTDNSNDPFQFEIPVGTIIPPHGFLLVWADGHSQLNTNTDPALHISFKLEQNGEFIGLYASDGVLIDAVAFGPQYADISEGRYPDGPAAQWVAPLSASTPGAPNAIYANRYPQIPVIPNATAYAGILFQFNVAATDPDAPSQSLTYSLAAGAPSNAMIHASSGEFSWTPTTAQAGTNAGGTTNVITIRVDDNGVPSLAAARSFSVIVKIPLLLGGITQSPNGDINFSVGTIMGRTYRVEYKDDLNLVAWTQLGTDHVAMSTTLQITDHIGPSQQRFYRVVQVN
jgi:hypothetical protein